MTAIDSFIKERLSGDWGRLAELFETREVYDVLRARATPGDWYHFEPKTFDGQYLVETAEGWQTYQQDRGTRSAVRDFKSLREAASHLFS